MKFRDELDALNGIYAEQRRTNELLECLVKSGQSKPETNLPKKENKNSRPDRSSDGRKNVE